MNANLQVLSLERIRSFQKLVLGTQAETLVHAFTSNNRSLAFAESLTGGLLADAIVSVPGASSMFLGSAVTYATAAKGSVLDVSQELLQDRGAVDPLVAAQMAVGTRALFGASVGVSVTGVAGPDPQDGKPVGLVYFCLYDADVEVYEVRLSNALLERKSTFGDVASRRQFIRELTVKVIIGVLNERYGCEMLT